MLKDFVKAEKPADEEFAKRLEDERAKLFAAQMKIKEAGLPVMVIFEGWGAAGKGSVLGKVIKNIDPRFFKVKTYAAPTAEDKRYRWFFPKLSAFHIIAVSVFFRNKLLVVR